jgi:hypothetical protein
VKFFGPVDVPPIRGPVEVQIFDRKVKLLSKMLADHVRPAQYGSTEDPSTRTPIRGSPSNGTGTGPARNDLEQQFSENEKLLGGQDDKDDFGQDGFRQRYDEEGRKHRIFRWVGFAVVLLAIVSSASVSIGFLRKEERYRYLLSDHRLFAA